MTRNQKVNAVLFSCQLVRSDARSLFALYLQSRHGRNGCGLRSAPFFYARRNLGLGKRAPLFGRILGHSFPNRPLGESASQNTGLKWDALSQTRLKGKLRPSLRPQNGMNFPPDQPTLSSSPSTTCILNFVHRKYMNRCSMHLYLPASFLSKNFATPKTQLRQGFSCSTVGT